MQSNKHLQKEDPLAMRKENAEQTRRSFDETQPGTPDQRQRASMSLKTSSASHPSTGSRHSKLSSRRPLVSPGQSTSGRDTDPGSSRSQSCSYGMQTWLDQTPQEEPWNAVGCGGDFDGLENTNEASNATTGSASGSRSRSCSYGMQTWLDQTPQEEPWNAAGGGGDFDGLENTNEASNATTGRASGSQNGSKNSKSTN